MPCQDTVSLSIQHTSVYVQHSCCVSTSTSASTSATALGLGCLACGIVGVLVVAGGLCCLINGRCPSCRRLALRSRSWKSPPASLCTNQPLAFNLRDLTRSDIRCTSDPRSVELLSDVHSVVSHRERPPAYDSLDFEPTEYTPEAFQ
ncbi:non-structural protein NS5 [Aquareovirus ctenopharyngodontis]|uniref:Non-structural protein 5 n=1 Tax=Aquareovirus C (isolate Golden shiner/USA/GSRV/1977) TaxID=185783 RepID=VNS5_AQRVC|nr:non-structural protein NS5 [Aquareovirus C]Q8JU56.1 RecName: Full=Non-structural protein 5; Short=NS5 [Golden shiner reovirus]AAM92750.1 non-structural protein NS5 [Golden shiner reovirus]